MMSQLERCTAHCDISTYLISQLIFLNLLFICTHPTAALAHAETAAATAKTEYDIVLSEMRDPAFIEEYGAERLTLAKEQAKDMLTTANRCVLLQ
jgi:hypothetical protein